MSKVARSGGSGFRREIGLLALTFISVGSIIGSSWLLGALTAASSAGGASIVSWLLAGVIIALLALVHSELGAAYPLAGGTGRWPQLAFGSLGGFTAGWVAWVQAVTIAPFEVEAVLSYLDHVWHGLINEAGALTLMGLGVATILMLVFTIINILGVRLLTETNTIAVLWKIVVPVLIIGVLVAMSFRASNFTAGGGFAPYGAHGVFAALPLGVVAALYGFEQAAQLAGEARDPQRTVPRAIIYSVIVVIVLYLGLEIAFIGALNPGNLVRGWANPVAKGDFGPYATLASGLGLSWLTVILYITAVISPASTGLVYVGASARLSYALAHTGYAPKSISRISARGVPYGSIILSFVIGLICFLPFPSWKSLVGLVTSVTVIMYGFAPVTLLALRKADPHRIRPYRLPAAWVLAPLAFITANEIIYWTAWATVEKLMLIVLVGYVVFGISYVLGRPIERPPLDLRSLVWILPWLVGLTTISYLGQYGGTRLIPEWVDLGVVAALSLAICYAAVRLSQPTLPVTIYLSDESAHEQVEAAVESLLGSVGAHIELQDDPAFGSWFSQMWARTNRAMRSPFARKATIMAAHAAESRLVHAQDADVTAKLLQNLGPVLASLQQTENAVIRTGALLIVKEGVNVVVHQLTSEQQFKLEHEPHLLQSPHSVLFDLKLLPGSSRESAEVLDSARRSATTPPPAGAESSGAIAARAQELENPSS